MLVCVDDYVKIECGKEAADFLWEYQRRLYQPIMGYLDCDLGPSKYGKYFEVPRYHAL